MSLFVEFFGEMLLEIVGEALREGRGALLTIGRPAEDPWPGNVLHIQQPT